MRTRDHQILLDADYIVSHAIKHDTIGSGIYFLLSGREIVYVGRAVNFIRRIKQHKDKSFDRWFWVPCPADSLGALEQEYISRLAPRLNKDAYGKMAKRKALKKASGPTTRKPKGARGAAPSGCYWRGDVLWGRKKIRGREFRASLETSNRQDAARRRAEWVRTIEFTASHIQGHSDKFETHLTA